MARYFRLDLFCFIVQGALLLCAKGKHSMTKPNIVILLADDVSARDCRVYTNHAHLLVCVSHSVVCCMACLSSH